MFTVWNVSKYRVFSGLYFPAFGPEKTPYLDTFHAVVIKLLRMRKLTLEGKITIFKSLAISEIVHLAIITKVPNIMIEKLKNFLWDNKTVKIKWFQRWWFKECRYRTYKTASLTVIHWKFSWVENYFFAIYNKHFGKNFKFTLNLMCQKIPTFS